MLGLVYATVGANVAHDAAGAVLVIASGRHLPAWGVAA